MNRDFSCLEPSTGYLVICFWEFLRDCWCPWMRKLVFAGSKFTHREQNHMTSVNRVFSRWVDRDQIVFHFLDLTYRLHAAIVGWLGWVHGVVLLIFESENVIQPFNDVGKKTWMFTDRYSSHFRGLYTFASSPNSQKMAETFQEAKKHKVWMATSKKKKKKPLQFQGWWGKWTRPNVRPDCSSLCG